MAGSTHSSLGCPHVGKLSSDPHAEPPLSQCGREVTGALGEREGARTRRGERGLVPAGVEEAVGKGDGTARFRRCWHMHSHLYIFHEKFSKKPQSFFKL